MSVNVEMSLGALDKYEVLEASDTEYPEAKCVDVTHKDAIDYFKEWYYLNVALPEVEDCAVQDIYECMDQYEVHFLDDFIDEYLDNTDYKEHQKKYFDVESFVYDLMNKDGYSVYINKGGDYQDLDNKEISDYVYITEQYYNNKIKYICKTEYNMFILKKIEE